jgi:hypothetical protein
VVHWKEGFHDAAHAPNKSSLELDFIDVHGPPVRLGAQVKPTRFVTKVRPKVNKVFVRYRRSKVMVSDQAERRGDGRKVPNRGSDDAGLWIGVQSAHQPFNVSGGRDDIVVKNDNHIRGPDLRQAKQHVPSSGHTEVGWS